MLLYEDVTAFEKFKTIFETSVFLPEQTFCATVLSSLYKGFGTFQMEP